MKLRRAASGMTLIELLITITIVGLLAALAIPAFRGIQARQALKTAQREVQTALYRLQELALAPEATTTADYDVIGYGLLIYNQSTDQAGGGVTIENCTLSPAPENDFLALVKYVRLRNSSARILPILNAGTPDSGCQVDPSRAKDDFYVLPTAISMVKPDTAWLVSVPLKASGEQFGTLSSTQFNDPFTTSQAPELVLANRSVRVGLPPQPLCQAILFARDTTGVTLTTERVTNAEQCL